MEPPVGRTSTVPHGAPRLCHERPQQQKTELTEKSDAADGIARPAVQTFLLTRRGGPRLRPHQNRSRQPQKIPVSRPDQSVWGEDGEASIRLAARKFSGWTAICTYFFNFVERTLTETEKVLRLDS